MKLFIVLLVVGNIQYQSANSEALSHYLAYFQLRYGEVYGKYYQVDNSTISSDTFMFLFQRIKPRALIHL